MAPIVESMVHDFTSPLAHPISPEEIEHRPFAPVKKGGIDEASVRGFLRQVAAFVEQQEAQAQAREEAFERQISQLREQLEHPSVPTGQQLVELVGDEVARTLRTAQESSDEMRAKAEERALRIVRDAQDEAHRIREEQLEHANENARAMVESARERGREMVGEARALRERVIADLNRRREALQEQLQALRTGREELAATYRTLKQTFDEADNAFARFEAGRPFDAVHVDVPPPPLLPPEPPERHEPIEPIEQRAGARVGALEIGELPATDTPVEEGVVEDAAAAPAAEPIPEPEPKPEPKPEPMPEPAAAVPTEPEPEPEPEPKPEPPASPPPSPRPPSSAPSPSATPAPGPVTPDLDEIFKRIRAGRVGDAGAPPPDRPTRPAPDAGDQSEASSRGGISTVAGTMAAPASSAGPATRTLTIAREEEAASDPADDDPTTAADGQALAVRDELLADVAVDAARSYKRALQDEQNELLDRLRRQRRGVSVEKLLPPLVDQVSSWADVLAPSLDRVYVEARASAAGEPPAIGSAPRRLVAAMAETLVSPLRDRVTAAVVESTDSDPDAIAQRIGARYREWKGQELDARIGDVLAATYARAVYDAAPEGSRLRWIPADRGKCSDCDDNALEPTLRGNRFPTGQPFPPAHPGCRCLLAVVQ